jgi:hypothetical protein
MEQQMSLRDVAALLNCKAYRIEYLLCHGLVAEPKLRISGRRVFGPEDVANIRAHFEAKQKSAKPVEKPTAEAAGV